MTELNIEDIRENLIAARDGLFAKINSNDLSVNNAEIPDPVDLAVQNYSKNVMLAVSENETRQLQMVDEALQRIEDEEYGICQHCSKSIQLKRLEAIPWARYCLACQELVEQGLVDSED